MNRTLLTDERLEQHGNRALQILDTYWHRLATKGDMPSRSEIDPGEIQDALEYAFICDRVGRSHARLRVAGGAINSVMGRDPAQMPLSALLNPGARGDFDAAVTRFFARPQILEVSLATAASPRRVSAMAKLRLYPLRNDQHSVSHLLGGFVTSGEIAPAPCRFDITEMRNVPLGLFEDRKTLRQNRHLRLVVDNA